MEFENRVSNNIIANSDGNACTPAKKSMAQSKMSTPSATNSVNRSINTPKVNEGARKVQTTGKKLTRAPFSPISASGSVFTLNSSGAVNSREAARIAREQCTSDRIQKVALLKEKWAKEKEMKTQNFQERRMIIQQKLSEECDVAAEQRRKNLEKKREIEEKERLTKKEQLSASLEARSQLAKDLEDQAKAKRRISIFLNNKMRQNALSKQAKLDAEKKQREADLLASRRIDFLELRELKKEEEERRVEELRARTIEAQEQKRLAEEKALKAKEEEKNLLEMRRENWKDDQAAREHSDRRRRESIAARIDEWRMQKSIEEEAQKADKLREADLLKTREESWRDVQSYKNEIEKRKRESLSFRLDKWREEKALSDRALEQEKLAAEMERELQCQADQDVKNYQEKIKESRRQSLAYRIDKARKDKDFEQGQKALEQMVLEEQKRIEALDRDDVNNYRQKIIDARRQSLEYRNQTEYQERLRKEGEKQTQKMMEEADRQMQEAAWKDVQQYREQQRSEARKSIAWRIADAHRQQQVDISIHEDKLNRLHLDLQCRREDWLSLQDYKKEEAERRRKSISLRLESWRTHRLMEEKEREKKEMIAEEDAILREMDREELFAAKLAQDMMDRKKMLSSDIVL